MQEKKICKFLELRTSLNVVFMICKKKDSELLELISSSYDICVISGFSDENYFYLVLSLHNICMISGECYIDTAEQAFSFYVTCLTLEILAPSYNICMTIQKVVLSLQDVRFICKYYKKWVDICDVGYYEDAFIDLISFSHQECTSSDTSLRCGIAHETVHYVTFSLRSLLKVNDASMMLTDFVKEAGNCKFIKSPGGKSTNLPF
jgi:hypothetical protein